MCMSNGSGTGRHTVRLILLSLLRGQTLRSSTLQTRNPPGQPTANNPATLEVVKESEEERDWGTERRFGRRAEKDQRALKENV